jgi:hypothetical protein
LLGFVVLIGIAFKADDIMEIPKVDLSLFKDSLGMIGHKDLRLGLEFGDGLQRTFSFYIYQFYTLPMGHIEIDRIEKILTKIYRELPPKAQGTFPGRWQYCRHWTQSQWYGELWTCSRDQLIPLWIACCLFGRVSARIFEHQKNIEQLMKERRGLCWNYKQIWCQDGDEPRLPDWVNPFFRRAMYIRGQSKDVSVLDQLSLQVCDLELVVMSLILSSRAGEDSGDDLNFQLHLIFALSTHETAAARVARWIYLKFRRAPVGEEYEGLPMPVAVQKSYFRSPMAPPMWAVAWPALMRWLK